MGARRGAVVPGVGGVRQRPLGWIKGREALSRVLLGHLNRGLLVATSVLYAEGHRVEADTRHEKTGSGQLAIWHL